jgi:hypothetical protein
MTPCVAAPAGLARPHRSHSAPTLSHFLHSSGGSSATQPAVSSPSSSRASWDADRVGEADTSSNDLDFMDLDLHRVLTSVTDRQVEGRKLILLE